jgi:hypothetical protein
MRSGRAGHHQSHIRNPSVLSFIELRRRHHTHRTSFAPPQTPHLRLVTLSSHTRIQPYDRPHTSCTPGRSGPNFDGRYSERPPKRRVSAFPPRGWRGSPTSNIFGVNARLASQGRTFAVSLYTCGRSISIQNDGLALIKGVAGGTSVIGITPRSQLLNDELIHYFVRRFRFSAPHGQRRASSRPGEPLT